MRKMVDPRETEMFEKCDLADAVQRMQIKERKQELDKITGFQKLWPMIKPKFYVWLGIFLLACA